MINKIMNILMLGPPGSGKGSQSKFIGKFFDIVCISVGELLRKEVFKNTSIGQKIENKLANGLLVDNKIIFCLLKKKFKRFENILLDGYPRTIDQALFLDSMNFKFNYVIKLIVKKNILIKRVKYRLINNYISKSYSILYDLPKIKYKDDETGARIFARLDDKYLVFNTRLSKYEEQIQLILNFFIKKNVRIIEVNAEKKALNVFKKIRSEIYKNE